MRRIVARYDDRRGYYTCTRFTPLIGPDDKTVAPVSRGRVELDNRERKCADTIGTVLVPRACH